jgi:riboflavin transporter FmnP
MNGMNAVSAASNTISKEAKKVKLLSARGLTAMALLSALATVLMLFDIPLGFLPYFYQVDFSEVPVLIGAFALGPVAGIVIEFLKILLNLLLEGSDTAAIGEFSNFLLGCFLVVPAAAIYYRKRSRKYAILGMGVGTIAFIIAGCLLNAYLLLPTYSKIYGMPIDNLIAVGTKVNPNINGMFTFILFAVAPFNLIKGVAVSIVTILIYKYISPIIKGYHRTK